MTKNEYTKEQLLERVNTIKINEGNPRARAIITRITATAEADDLPTHVAANKIAEARITSIAATRHIRVRGFQNIGHH